MKNQIAKDLLDIEAVFLKPNDPFTWSSGIMSPIYCDNRITLSYVDVRKRIEKGLAEIVKAKFPECESLMGTATAGIAHAALVADILDIPMGYVRSSAKKHGRTNQIEGRITPGMKVVVVEDLISTGGSSIDAVNALKDAGCEVLGVIAIFTYNLPKATDNFNAVNVPYEALTDFNTLCEVAEKDGKITSEDLSKLVKWSKNPSDEAWMQ